MHCSRWVVVVKRVDVALADELSRSLGSRYDTGERVDRIEALARRDAEFFGEKPSKCPVQC